MARKIPRIGVGGPVGSGKTALIEAMVPRLIGFGLHPVIITNDIFTREDADHARGREDVLAVMAHPPDVRNEAGRETRSPLGRLSV